VHRQSSLDVNEVQSGLVCSKQSAPDDVTPGEVDPQVGQGRSRFDVKNLLPGGVKVDHLKQLREAAKALDSFRRETNSMDAVKFSELKLELSLANSVEEIVERLG